MLVSNRVISPVVHRSDDLFDANPRAVQLLQFMVDTNLCIYVMQRDRSEIRHRLNRPAELVCIFSIASAKPGKSAAARRDGRRRYDS
jgi:hypothetical protein